MLKKDVKSAKYQNNNRITFNQKLSPHLNAVNKW